MFFNYSFRKISFLNYLTQFKFKIILFLSNDKGLFLIFFKNKDLSSCLNKKF